MTQCPQHSWRPLIQVACWSWRVPFLSVWVAFLLAGCGGGGAPKVEVSPATEVSPTVVASQPCVALPETGDIAAGRIQDGPFTFDLALYADPSIKSRTEAEPSHASDIPGVGWRATWTYRGPDIPSAMEATGPIPDLFPRSEYPLTDGLQGGREGGGVLLPKGAKPGDRVGLAIKMATSTGTHGAVTAFTLVHQGGRIQPCNIGFFPWPGPADLAYQ